MVDRAGQGGRERGRVICAVCAHASARAGASARRGGGEKYRLNGVIILERIYECENNGIMGIMILNRNDQND